jgi:putative hydrolase of the HAD superfamily
VDEQWGTATLLSRRPALEAVVFDAGGTLVRIDFEWISSMLAELGVVASPEEVRAAEVAGRRRYDAAAGRTPRTPVGGPHPVLGSVGPGQAYFAGMLEAAGCRHPVLEEALERVSERQASAEFLWGRPMEGARQALDALASLGVRLGCVSNSDGRAEQHLVACGVRDGLEFVLDSQLVGIEKPDPRIFRLALERLSLPAERTAYVGDIRSVDEAGARAAGMHFVLVDPSGEYAAPGSPSIRRLDELPAHLASRFTLVPSRRAPHDPRS